MGLTGQDWAHVVEEMEIAFRFQLQHQRGVFRTVICYNSIIWAQNNTKDAEFGFFLSEMSLNYSELEHVYQNRMLIHHGPSFVTTKLHIGAAESVDLFQALYKQNTRWLSYVSECRCVSCIPQREVSRIHYFQFADRSPALLTKS